ncbi:[protein release factor]-glutamine N5-methyltransferase [Sinobacterium caligoides]|uniref:Release factor glutamine methyltransferase n=1 Tax=Sinobacterium caligoides TaxID=933926 RepID=A0A3N2E0X1_9GAMM|nr:peptide chain release factor N(5)-glutamine methyltransferase [Sinobacterium caligoides]ROS05773.1 [protein release factor]-glutamine N5-methyltransferase [Sinobacterium caligoides]
MSSIACCLRRSTELEAHSDTARLDVELLLADSLGRDRTYLRTWPERQLSDSQLQQFEQAMRRRLAGEPIAHILGYRDFWTLRLAVNPSTLIPRPDTETLVEQALELFDPEQRIELLDLGTGTGAIALALASECPKWRVTAVDVADDAVALAKQNRDSHGLNQVQILHSDWFGALAERRFELIISNPPYIAYGDHHLSEGDVRFEPDSALTADRQGMADIEHIADCARAHLCPAGWLLFEHGYDQAARSRDCLRTLGYVDVASIKDLAGIERATLGRWPADALVPAINNPPIE